MQPVNPEEKMEHWISDEDILLYLKNRKKRVAVSIEEVALPPEEERDNYVVYLDKLKKEYDLASKVGDFATRISWNFVLSTYTQKGYEAASFLVSDILRVSKEVLANRATPVEESNVPSVNPKHRDTIINMYSRFNILYRIGEYFELSEILEVLASEGIDEAILELNAWVDEVADEYEEEEWDIS